MEFSTENKQVLLHKIKKQAIKVIASIKKYIIKKSKTDIKNKESTKEQNNKKKKSILLDSKFKNIKKNSINR